MFLTFAVASIRIVTGPGPQSKRMTPPSRTAATTAAEVQLAGVPCPTIRSGRAPATGAANARPEITATATARLTDREATRAGGRKAAHP